MAQRITGILYDLGDTLINFGRVDTRALFEAGGRLAYDYLRELDQPLPPFARFHGHQLRSIRLHYLMSILTGREFNSLDLMAKLSRRMRQSLTREQLEELAWRWYEPLAAQSEVEPEAAELLAEFSEAGIAQGIVSNTFVPGEVLDRHLHQAGLLRWLPVRVYSCDEKIRKPRRRIFDRALDRVGTTASETLFVGDSIKADIRGANRAGLISVLKGTGNGTDRPIDQPVHRIDRLVELRRIVSESRG
jgi:putative hydrolase of the HAD superfamily